MRYCRKCVQPDTRPGIVFDEEGVCAACRIKDRPVDWDMRHRELVDISERSKRIASERNCPFDCVVGVSGGKDSHVQALYAKEELNLKCLLVNCVPDGITDVGKHNIENLVCKGFDMIAIRPNPLIMRAATKRAFFEFGNPVKPSEYPLYAVSYNVALKYDIPLIIQGENAAGTLGVTGDLEANGDAMNVYKYHTLAGCNASDWVQEGIKERDLYFYQYPDIEELRERTEAIFIAYYMKDWSYSRNIDFSISQGIHGRILHDPERTGRISPYCSIDSDMQILNQMLKYLKLGFGFVTDEVCYWIRNGEMTREKGIDLVKEYDGKCDIKYIGEFCDYIGIAMKEFLLSNLESL